jgi:hypothetical protein
VLAYTYPSNIVDVRLTFTEWPFSVFPKSPGAMFGASHEKEGAHQKSIFNDGERNPGSYGGPCDWLPAGIGGATPRLRGTVAVRKIRSFLSRVNHTGNKL